MVFIGGDIMPALSYLQSSSNLSSGDFLNGFIAVELSKLKDEMKNDYPRIFVILGNDDARFIEPTVLDIAGRNLWEYIHFRRVIAGEYTIYGYSYIPPSPFQLKDWERYDVSRYVDPGCISPEEGRLSVPVAPNELKYSSIQKDLVNLTRDFDLSKSVFLFHSPPYRTKLDRSALDGKEIDHVPLDVHIGSIAIRRFIKNRQPLLTLHGHVHESTNITGEWKDKIGNTFMFNAADIRPDLCLIKFNLSELESVVREFI